MRAFLDSGRKGQLDLPMAREGGFAGGFFAIFVPSPDRKPREILIKSKTTTGAKIGRASCRERV